MDANRRLTTVWVVLIALTLGSFVVGVEQSPQVATWGALLIIALALVKIRLIGVHYMDLRSAPRALRHLFDGYLLVVFAVLGGIDLFVGV